MSSVFICTLLRIAPAAPHKLTAHTLPKILFFRGVLCRVLALGLIVVDEVGYPLGFEGFVVRAKFHP